MTYIYSTLFSHNISGVYWFCSDGSWYFKLYCAGAGRSDVQVPADVLQHWVAPVQHKFWMIRPTRLGPHLWPLTSKHPPSYHLALHFHSMFGPPPVLPVPVACTDPSKAPCRTREPKLAAVMLSCPASLLPLSLNTRISRKSIWWQLPMFARLSARVRGNTPESMAHGIWRGMPKRHTHNIEQLTDQTTNIIQHPAQARRITTKIWSPTLTPQSLLNRFSVSSGGGGGE